VQLLPPASVAPQVVVPVAKLLADVPLIWKLTLAIGAPPVLVIFSVCVLEEPTATMPKLRLAGLTVKAGASSPVPDKATVFGESEALSVTVSVPLAAPAAVGRKNTLIVQLEAAARLRLQLLVAVNGPLAAVAIEVRAAPPLLVSDTVSTAESWSRTVPGKVSDVAESVSVVAVSPLPLSATCCVPAESVNVSVPVAAPAALGINWTIKLQEPAGISATPNDETHVLLAIANGPVIVLA
jgi:hypothetical protein